MCHNHCVQAIFQPLYKATQMHHRKLNRRRAHHLSSCFIVLLLIVLQPAWSQTQYVTDEIEVMVRTGPSLENRIITPLKSGEPVQILIEDAGNAHSQIQTRSGKIGFVLKRFLSNNPSAKSQVASLRARLNALESSPDDARNLLLNTQQQNEGLVEENLKLSEQLAKSKAELEQLRDLSRNAIAQKREHLNLAEENKKVTLQLEQMRLDNMVLSKGTKNDGIFYGVGAILIGLFLGWVLSITGKNRKSGWR